MDYQEHVKVKLRKRGPGGHYFYLGMDSATSKRERIGEPRKQPPS
jgi:hypothetical protein